MLRRCIENHLREYKNTRIKLTEIENIVPADTDYGIYASLIEELLKDGILTCVKSAGVNGRTPALPLKFNIIKSELNKDVIREITEFLFHRGQYFKLDYYLNQTPKYWEADKTSILRIFNYLERHKGYPKQYASSQERSYEISGNEKWMDHEGGTQVLKRLKIYEEMLINTQSTPAMFAINVNRLNHTQHRHLIVENKATYYGLLDSLSSSGMSTLIFGAGWQVIDSIKDFDRQFPLEGTHEFYYFGDIDFEGIRIAKRLSEIKKLKLATSFYKALLQTSKSQGKENQRRDKQLCTWFIERMPFAQEKMIQLEKGYYWPQEALDDDQLKEIMENNLWT